ncbi:MAG TPA: polyamine aminopropyltransferase [Campylobacterales bacterium]|nr:polyamine aminopropyltransferase [Campylobacterales bacterium]
MYFTEEHGFIKQSLKIEKKLYEIKSRYQHIEVYKSKELGNILVIDKNAMLSQYDEFIYHEMLSHVPICTHPNPKKVLIIGGGDGGTAREVLRHPTLEVDMVEIDEEVIEVCKNYFPDIGDWDNPRLNLIVGNGVEFIKNAKEKSYDIILVDSTDDKDQASGLFKPEFYTACSNVLKDDGMIAVQGSSYFVALDEHKEILKKLGKEFDIVMPYRYEMLTYPGVIWNFILASKKYHPLRDTRHNDIKNLKYYNEDIHKASFALPEYIKNVL